MTEVVDSLHVAPAQALAGLLGRERGGPSPGDVVRPGFHWLYFSSFAHPDDTGVDGHPQPDAAAAGARRMFAGARIEWRRPLRHGQEARRSVRLVNETQKETRSGPMLLRTYEHRIDTAGGLCIREEQDIVYLSGSPSSGTVEREGERLVGISRKFAADPVKLFRFSALTHNSHRIHYDHRYATTVEGYPDLVVHGPLLAVSLLDLAADIAPSPGAISRFSFRARRPLFVGEPAMLEAQVGGARILLQAVGKGGVVHMTASAEIAG